MNSDPGYQLLAAEQHLRGESPSANTLVTRDVTDLARPHHEWITWWAPGTTIAAYPFLASGFSVGEALRWIAIACEILGAVGWIAWCLQFRLRPAVMYSLAVLFPWVHYGWNGIFEFSAETLLFGFVPWLMVSTVATARRWRASPGKPLLSYGALVGTLLGVAYVVKYSAVLATAGAVAFLMISALDRQGGDRLRRLWKWMVPPSWSKPECSPASPQVARARVLAVTCGFILPIATLNLLNRWRGIHSNLVSESLGSHVDWRAPLYALANPAMMLADGDGLLRYVFLHPGHSLLTSTDSLLVMTVPAGVILVWLVFGQRACDDAALLAQWVFCSSVAAILLIWTVSTGVSFEARHVATAGLTVLPLALRRAIALCQTGGWLRRTILVLFAIGFIATPLLYGVGGLIGKSRRLASGYRVGEAGIYNPLLAPQDIVSCRRNLLDRPGARSAVWYLTDPLSALDLEVPAVIEHADFVSIDDLRNGPRFVTSRSLEFYLLLPRRFEQNGKGSVIRSRTTGAQSWRSTAVADCEYILWSAELAPQSEARPRSMPVSVSAR